MKRKQAITLLKDQATALKAMGATSLYLFGSTARNKASRTSDLDVFIDYNRKKPISLFKLVGIQNHLRHALRTRVDLTTRNSLHPLLRDDIEHSAIRVF